MKSLRDFMRRALFTSGGLPPFAIACYGRRAAEDESARSIERIFLCNQDVRSQLDSNWNNRNIIFGGYLWEK